MKALKLFTITSLLCICVTLSSHAQYNPTLQFSTDNAGTINYEIDNAGDKTHVFTLFGDGMFSTHRQPVHVFKPNANGYVTESYFARVYDPNLPPKKTIHIPPFSNVGTPNTTANPTVQMTGNIHLMTSWATAYDYENFYIIAFRNTTSQRPVDGCIEFHYNEHDIDVNFLEIKEYNNWVTNRTLLPSNGTFTNKIVWNFTDLAHNETRYVYVPATTKKAIGEEINLEVKYSIDCRELSNGSDYTFLTRRYPHDPNFKIVDKQCLTNEISEQQKLTYTIGFFNDGEYFAQNVFVKDILPSELVVSTVQLVDYEVQPTLSFQNNTMFINFLNINLPGTEQTIPQMYSYDDAFTYFSFEVCTKTNLSNCISNTASIIFDSQPVFFTNRSKICVEADCSGFEICSNSTSRRSPDEPQFKGVKKTEELVFNVYPNPISNQMNIDINFQRENASNFTVKLMDYSGKIIKEFTVNQQNSSIYKRTFNFQRLSTGLYFITLETAEGRCTKKIIKN
ncbi:T9SS type A sorting domain-containing protein [Kordia sp. YSTF-M3]|uniref:T9SS type A sorting domain-containing protein n=1 Tax=Kordia aestuariivivens TaxID=2759037 RepID=A0ABR7QFX1_9FLAO|nr:T9SS type A sorting domain-containing protein [Kordia aestuariivivens]MBC8757462.1 T9SS type A sorting domain-containing protein [Kordia aestuariivivens]